MFDGLIKLPPVLLFMLVTPPVLYFTEEGALALVTGLVCALAHLSHSKSRMTTVLVAGALVYMLVDNAPQWYMSFDVYPTALLCAAAASLVYEEMQEADHDAHAVRKLAYKIVVSGALIMAAVYTNALITLMKDDPTLTPALTTTRNCTEVAAKSGFILTDSSFSIHCPTRVWEYLRKDILLLVQAYVLFTLTTAMRHDMEGAVDSSSIRSLTVVECFAWTLASVIQFNDIAGCYRIEATTVALTSVAVVCHTLRAKGNWHESSGTVLLHGSWAHPNLRAKLKL
jgi:hypothetical protein